VKAGEVGKVREHAADAGTGTVPAAAAGEPAKGQYVPSSPPAPVEAAAPGPTVSIIVPVDEEGAAFRQCLASLRALSPAPEEVIIVTDGNGAGTRELAAGAGFRVVECPRRGGPARARNLGARRARGEVLLFVDADVTVPPRAVGQVAEQFRSRGGPDAVIGSYDDAPAEPNFLSQYRNLLHHYVHQTAREEACTFWGACGAVRRDVFLRVGGFSEEYPQPSIEDIELGARLRRGGHAIRLCKALQVKHWKRWSAGSLLRTDIFRRALPWTALILRQRRFPNDLNLRWSSRASVALLYAMLALLVAGAWWRWCLVAAAGAAVAAAALNAPLYRFFLRKRGAWFALRAVPWHWLYYLYGGLAFAVGLVGCGLRRSGRRPRAAPD